MWELIDRAADKYHRGNRSSYFRELVGKDLSEEGRDVFSAVAEQGVVTPPVSAWVHQLADELAPKLAAALGMQHAIAAESASNYGPPVPTPGLKEIPGKWAAPRPPRPAPISNPVQPQQEKPRKRA